MKKWVIGVGLATALCLVLVGILGYLMSKENYGEWVVIGVLVGLISGVFAWITSDEDF